MTRTKQINKVLKHVKSTRRIYNTYGKIHKVYASTVLYISDIVIPSFRALSFIAFVLQRTKRDIHLFNITVHNKNN